MDDAPYGNCPICGRPGVTRCLCLMGDTRCTQGHGWHFRGSEVHLTDYPADGSHPRCGPRCRVVRAGTLSAAPPSGSADVGTSKQYQDMCNPAIAYKVPDRCYGMATRDYPEAGGFRTELDDTYQRLDECKSEFKQSSPGPYCAGVREACVMCGVIPKGTATASITPKMIADCVAVSRKTAAQAMVHNFCDGKQAPAAGPSGTDAGPGTGDVASGSGSKSSALPWLLGGLALAAVVGGAVVLSKSKPASKRNPTGAEVYEGYFATGYGDVVGAYEKRNRAVQAYVDRFGDIPEEVVYGRWSGERGDEVVGHVLFKSGYGGFGLPRQVERSEPIFILTDEEQIQGFTLGQFSEANEDLDRAVIDAMRRMKAGQSLRFDMGAGGSFGIKRIQ